MSLITTINQYNGINPHLNDKLQQDGLTWKEFHDTHIADMRRLLNKQLVPRGYEAKLVSGLQLTALDLDTLNYDPLHPIQPDVAIRQHADISMPPHGVSPADPGRGADYREQSIPEALHMTEDEYLNALAIVRIDASHEEPPMAWIEYLSKSNKPGGSHHTKYETKVMGLLGQGIPLVQIDHLNQTPPVMPAIPRYPDAPGSKPYYVAVSDPRPTDNYPHGNVQLYPFGIEEPVPTVFIPFRDGEGADFDFDRAYDETIETAYAWHVDYEQPPINLAAYSQHDANAIAARMYTVLQAGRTRVLTSQQTQPLPLACAIEEGPAYLAARDTDNPALPDVSLDI